MSGEQIRAELTALTLLWDERGELAAVVTGELGLLLVRTVLVNATDPRHGLATVTGSMHHLLETVLIQLPKERGS